MSGAAAKFEQLIRESERALRNLHEKITLVEGEAKAQETTTLESRSELQERISKGDDMADIRLKWGARLIKFASWAAEVAKSLG